MSCFDLLFSEATYLLEKGQYKDAILVAEHLATVEPDNVKNLDLLASILEACKDYQGASVVYERAHAIEGSNTERLERHALLLESMTQCKEAISKYEKCLTLQPDNLRLLLKLGELTEMVGQPADAETYYRRFQSLEPRNFKAASALARLLHEKSKGKGADALELALDAHEILNKIDNLHEGDEEEVSRRVKMMEIAELIEELQLRERVGCRVCSKPAPNACSRCKKEAYCDRTCQLKHWSFHKKVCKSSGAESPTPSAKPSPAAAAASSTPIMIRDLRIGVTHTGKCLQGVIAEEPFQMSAIHITLVDAMGQRMPVAVYNYPGYGGSISIFTQQDLEASPSRNLFKKGDTVRVRDPYCKIAMDGQIVVRVDDFSTIEIVSRR